MPQDKISAVFQCHLCGVIGRAVINHNYLNALDAFQLPWEIIQYLRQGLGFIISRDLDDQLFHSGAFCSLAITYFNRVFCFCGERLRFAENPCDKNVIYIAHA